MGLNLHVNHSFIITRAVIHLSNDSKNSLAASEVGKITSREIAETKRTNKRTL